MELHPATLQRSEYRGYLLSKVVEQSGLPFPLLLPTSVLEGESMLIWKLL